jgi:hypothetical protein
MPGQDVDALGEAFSTHNFAVINADKVTGETNFTATQNLVISNIVLHEIGHMITPKGPEFDHSLGGVMAPGTVMRDGVRAWTEYPRAILREAVTRFCRGGQIAGIPVQPASAIARGVPRGRSRRNSSATSRIVASHAEGATPAALA